MASEGRCEPWVKLFRFHCAHRCLGSPELQSSSKVVKMAHAQKFLQGMDAHIECKATSHRPWMVHPETHQGSQGMMLSKRLEHTGGCWGAPAR